MLESENGQFGGRKKKLHCLKRPWSVNNDAAVQLINFMALHGIILKHLEKKNNHLLLFDQHTCACNTDVHLSQWLVYCWYNRQIFSSLLHKTRLNWMTYQVVILPNSKILFIKSENVLQLIDKSDHCVRCIHLSDLEAVVGEAERKGCSFQSRGASSLCMLVRLKRTLVQLFRQTLRLESWHAPGAADLDCFWVPKMHNSVSPEASDDTSGLLCTSHPDVQGTV